MATSIAASQKSVWGFSPQSIPGLQLWLDAADTTSITGTSSVTAWRDKSGNGYHMNTLQPNGAYTSVYPTVGTTINGLNTVFFSAYAGLTQTVTLSGVKNFYWVGRLSTAGTTTGSCYNMLGHNTNYDWHGGNRGTGLYLNATFAEAGIRNATPVSIYGAGVTVTNTTFISLALPGDGSIHMVSAAGITDNTYTRYQGICYDRDNQQTGWVGDVGEAIVFSQALTTAQHQQVEGYLAAKWGLKANLPATHPYSATAIIPFNRPFYPTDISGCSLWLDGGDRSSMTFSGGTNTITQWNDKSGNGNNGIATGSPALTQTGINGRQAVTAAVGTCFLGPISMTGQSLTCFGVATTDVTLPNVRSPRADQRLVSLANGTNPDYQSNGMIPLFNQDSTSTIAAWNYNYGPGTLASNPIVTGTPFMAVSRLDGTTASLWFNGSAGTLASSSFSSSVTATKYGIGNQANPTIEYWSGFIGEVILFNTALSTPQRQQVEQYLANKWGLVANLPPGHPGKLMPAFSTGFTVKSISGCALWLDGADASTITGASSSVTAWKDKSGSGYSAVPNSGTISQSTLNGQNTLSFGTGVMRVDNFLWSSSFTQIFVGYVATGDIIIDTISTRYGDYVYTGNGTLFNVNTYSTDSGVLAVTDTVPGSVAPKNTWFIFCIGYGSTGTAAINYTINGTVRSTTVYPTTPPYTGGSATNPALPLYISGNTGSAGTGIQFAELIHFNSAITTQQRQQVEGYLAWKWGLQSNLPSTHAYAKFSP
jgi:hypothetical protein